MWQGEARLMKADDLGTSKKSMHRYPEKGPGNPRLRRLKLDEGLGHE